jgi:hypothetical protein
VIKYVGLESLDLVTELKRGAVKMKPSVGSTVTRREKPRTGRAFGGKSIRRPCDANTRHPLLALQGFLSRLWLLASRHDSALGDIGSLAITWFKHW